MCLDQSCTSKKYLTDDNLKYTTCYLYYIYLYGFPIKAVPWLFNHHSIYTCNDSRLIKGYITSKTWQTSAANCFTRTLVPENGVLNISFHDIKIPCNDRLWFLDCHQNLLKVDLMYELESVHVKWPLICLLLVCTVTSSEIKILTI